MSRWHPSRALPPLALAVTVLLVGYVILTGASRSSARSPLVRADLAIGAHVADRGDSLASIGDRFGVPLATLERLNPRVDPVDVSIGTRVHLR